MELHTRLFFHIRNACMGLQAWCTHPELLPPPRLLFKVSALRVYPALLYVVIVQMWKTRLPPDQIARDRRNQGDSIPSVPLMHVCELFLK